ncbi:MAG: STAS domain-containing protein [Desulfovibrionaceae bacterium]|jgi:anti-sigma B factor antagonist|nr:STAS domain-containing protein [Desulfovibrionaceae bacterium]
MEIVSKQEGKAQVLLVKGRMDAVTAPEFEEYVNSCTAKGATAFVVDLGGLEYISSAGLRSILASAKKLKALNGKILFCGLQGMVKEVFDISGFASMFSVFPTAQDALQKV